MSTDPSVPAPSARQRDQRLSVRGGNLFVREWLYPADTPRAPLLLLHDSLGSVAQWQDFPLQLARATARRVIAYDRLGFGLSSACHARPDVDFIRTEGECQVPALLDALDVPQAVLFGHSVGGAMALTAAAAQPARCVAVISESAQCAVEPRTLDGIRAAQAAFAEPEQMQRLARWHGTKAQWVLDAWTGVWLDPAFRHWTLQPLLPDVHCPVLAIHGDRDEYGSLAFPERIAAGVGGLGQMRILPGCGHVPHREQAGQVLAAVRDFLLPLP